MGPRSRQKGWKQTMARAWHVAIQPLASHIGCSLHGGGQRPGGTLHSTGDSARLSTSFSYSSTEQVGSSQETEAQTGRVAGLRSQTTNTTGQPELVTRPGSSVVLNWLKETRARTCNYPCLATEETGERNFGFHHLTPSTKEMEKLRTKVKGGPEAGPWD